MSQKQQGNSSSPLLAVLSQYRELRTNAASPDVEEATAKQHARDDQDETFDEDLEYVKRGAAKDKETRKIFCTYTMTLKIPRVLVYQQPVHLNAEWSTNLTTMILLTMNHDRIHRHQNQM